MRTLEVSLIEWPEGPERGGPRLLGRTSDPELVERMCRHLAKQRRRELAALEPPVCLVASPTGSEADDGQKATPPRPGGGARGISLSQAFW